MIYVIVILGVLAAILLLIQKGPVRQLQWTQDDCFIINEMFAVMIRHINEIYGEAATKRIISNTLKEIVYTYKLFSPDEITSRVDDYYDNIIGGINNERNKNQ